MMDTKRTAYPNRCKACLFWKAPERSNAREGECTRIDALLRVGMLAVIEPQQGSLATLRTAPDFGCAEHVQMAPQGATGPLIRGL